MGGHINTFIGGMDKDTSKQKYSNSKYVDANNIRPITDEGLSSGAIENIAGNKFAIDFPEIVGMSVIDITSAATDEDNTTKTLLNFTIETGFVQTRIWIPVITFTDATDLLSQIETHIIDKNTTLPEQLQFKYGILDNIDRIAVYNYATPITSISTDIYHTPEIFATSRDFIVIGSADLRNDIVLFTKNQTGQLDFGQIWRFSYDVARPEDPAYYSLELIYTGAVGFSLEHPIEAKAHYENSEVQRLVWTDYNDTLRGCNIKDNNTFAFRAQDFALTPETELAPAIAGRKNHTSGNLDSGLWYTTYRLSRLGGGVTNTAPFSSGIPVIVDDPTVGVGGGNTEYHLTNYAITSVPTTKSIDFTIFNIPKGHDRITIYAVHEKEPGNFTAYLYEDSFLSDTPNFDFTISDTDLKEVIPFTSLIDVNVEFEKVKTLTVKDSSLLVANVELANFDLDFDARTYRFRNNSLKQTYVGAGNNKILTPAQIADKNWQIALDDNVVNPYNKDKDIHQAVASGIALTDLDYSYKMDGVTRGGSGPNISYEFTTDRFLLDQASKADGGQTTLASPTDIEYPEQAPFVNNIAEDNVIKPINGEDMDIGPGFSNYKNPTFEAYFRGYMRDEVYRFGIVFYSKTGRPSEVKWIGDIKFPSAGDGQVDAEGYDTYSLGQYTTKSNGYFGLPTSSRAKIPGDQDGGTYGHTVGIKFDVDVSTVRDDISGYSIVRAPRKEKDRTIIAEGVLHMVDGFDVFTGTPAAGGLYKGNWKNDAWDTESIFIRDNIKPTSTEYEAEKGTPGNVYPKWEYGTLDCPDLKFITGAKMFGFKNRLANSTEVVHDYKLKPVALYSASRESVLTDVDTNGRIRDLYNWSPGGGDIAADYYSKSTTLINSCSTYDRYVAADSWGALKDIFYVDHGNGNESHAEIEDVAGTTIKFFNAGVIDLMESSTGGRVQAFGGIGTRTILFQGHNNLLTKRLINIAGGISPTSPDIDKDPYAVERDAGGTYSNLSNQLHNWGYLAGVNRSSAGMYALVDIYRPLEAQYGGDSFLARQETEYISTGHYTKVNKTTSGIDILSSEKVFGGDIVTTLWGEKKFYTYENNESTLWSPFTNGATSPRAEKGGIRGVVVPMQTIINTELRPLVHFNNYNSVDVSTGDVSLHRRNPDEYGIPILFHKEKNTQTYLVEGAGADLLTEYDNRAYLSNVKSNGETIDSWSVFESSNFKDVDGEYGPINKLETINDSVVFFQDKAFGTLAVNPRSVIQDTGGSDLTFGVGGGIVDHNYVSNTVGCSHQWGVRKTQTGLYFFDALHKKFYMFGGQTKSLSDLKGMSSWFYNKILGSAISKDNPILFEGMTTAYDQRFNEVIFTFHFYKDALDTTIETTLEDLVAGLTPTGTVSNTPFPNSNMEKPVSGIGEFIEAEPTKGDGSTTEVFTVTCPETLTKIWYDPSITSGLYKISMSDTLLSNIQAQLSGGSELYMTLPDGTYVPVTIANTNGPGFVYVSSPLFSPWDSMLSPKVDFRNISLKCIKKTYEANDGVLIDIKPVDDPTNVTVTESITTPNVDAFPNPDGLVSYTVVYNEMTQAFTSFYSHWPRHYFSNGRRIFSQDPSGYGLYVHDEGYRGQFYGTMYDSDLELMISPPGTHTKVFNNIEYLSQVYDNAGVNLVDVTIDRARFFNEYQNSQTVMLDPATNIKRRMRTWRMYVPRDGSARIRNPYMGTTIHFTNTANRRLVLHDVTTHYVDTPM